MKRRTANKNRLIQALRARIGMAEVTLSDPEVLVATEGTFLRATTELGLAVHDLCNELAKLLRK